MLGTWGVVVGVVLATLAQQAACLPPVLVCVLSAPPNIERRNLSRVFVKPQLLQACAEARLTCQFRFLLGCIDRPCAQRLKAERDAHSDLMIVRHHDWYFNSSGKFLSLFHHLHSIPRAPVLVKFDDDVYVDGHLLVRRLLHETSVLGPVPVWWGSFMTAETRRGDTPEARRTNRGIETSVWPLSELPLMARGLGWAMSSALVEGLLRHLDRLTDRVWAEDIAFGVWVHTVSQRTGVCFVFDYRWSIMRDYACAEHAHAIHTSIKDREHVFAAGDLVCTRATDTPIPHGFCGSSDSVRQEALAFRSRTGTRLFHVRGPVAGARVDGMFDI